MPKEHPRLENKMEFPPEESGIDGLSDELNTWKHYRYTLNRYIGVLGEKITVGTYKT